MTLASGQIVLVGTNVIIEAHRVGCWTRIAREFSLHTVEKVVEETQTGWQNRRPETLIDQGGLIAALACVASIDDAQRGEFNLTHGHPALDAGERDLLIYAGSLNEPMWLLNSPDMAAVRFAHGRGWHDRLISLEAMVKHLKERLREDLRNNYTERWLSVKRTELMLG